VPEALKGVFEPADPGFQKFLTEMHAAGGTQKHVDAAVAAFLSSVPKIAQGMTALDADACTSALKTEWAEPAKFDANMKAANRALSTFAGARADKLLAKLGNDPDAVWLLAQIGANLKADSTTAQGTGSANSIDDAGLNKLLASDAYRDPLHADHKTVSAQVSAAYAQKFKT
jgi:hypothetical protein